MFDDISNVPLSLVPGLNGQPTSLSLETMSLEDISLL
jgi:hypothetical protein